MGSESPDLVALPNMAVAEDSSVTAYTCARCGVVSSERTCFHFPAADGRGPRDTRCLTCEMGRQRRRLPQTAMLVGLNLAVLVGAFLHTSTHSPVQMLLAWAGCILLLPLVLALHEAGHMLVARALGMDIGCVVVGVGPRLWEYEIGSVPIQVNIWPIFGHVAMGLPTERFARLRLWLATVAGPAANLSMVWLSVHFWNLTQMLLGQRISVFWVLVNALIGVGNMLPFRGKRTERTYRSDGLALIKIPWESSAKLRQSAAGALLVRALRRHARRNYSGARSDCLLSSCLAVEGLLRECREVSAPVLDRSKIAFLRAWAKCNIATAIMMEDEAQSSTVADRLSQEAYEAFPCLLGILTDRALVLTWIGEPERALGILDYVHFERALPIERAEYSAAQAFALRMLGRFDDANRHMATARTLRAVHLDIVDKVMTTSYARLSGLTTAAGANGNAR
jgi:Peptidase family M50